MITALISAVAGLISGVVPDVLKEVKETRAHNREIEFTKLNHQLALDRVKLEVGAKLEESQAQAFAAEVAAAKESLVAAITAQASLSTGIRWLDGFNAFIRPATALAFVVVFMTVVVGTAFGFAHNEAIGVASATLFTEGFMAVIGFLFGYRSVSAQKKGAA
jgi:hypothetical protein